MYCRNSGILIAYILGTYFTYITSSYYFIGMTLIFLVGIWFVPSTPQYHLRKNNLVPAQKSFNFYNKHRLQSDPKFCMVQFDSLRDVANVNTTGPKLSWRDVGEYTLRMFVEVQHLANFFCLFVRSSRFAKWNAASDHFLHFECTDGSNRVPNVWIIGDRKIGYKFVAWNRIDFHGCRAAVRYIHHIQIDRQ